MRDLCAYMRVRHHCYHHHQSGFLAVAEMLLKAGANPEQPGSTTITTSTTSPTCASAHTEYLHQVRVSHLILQFSKKGTFVTVYSLKWTSTTTTTTVDPWYTESVEVPLLLFLRFSFIVFILV